jgi:mono/diheme cytochrome c family protein
MMRPLSRTLAALVLVLAAGGCARGTPREQRPVVVIPDMEFQAKFKAQASTPLFADGRTMRTPPAGTVARGTLKEDSTYYAGRADGEYVAVNPRPVTRELLERGRARYDIYCSPCHDRTGAGRGLVVQRGFVPAANFHDQRARDFQDGYIFSVVTHGVRNMPSYGAQIPPGDRWAIVAYVRALQRSWNATLDDVPPQARKELK